jgi:hypothetical protein
VGFELNERHSGGLLGQFDDAWRSIDYALATTERRAAMSMASDFDENSGRN